MFLKNTDKRGFVILYAVIISTVVLLIGVSMMNIITKQLVLSSISRNSKIAYYAALAGKECAEYWKNQGNYFGQVVYTYDAESGQTMSETVYADDTSRERIACPVEGIFIESESTNDETTLQLELPNKSCSIVHVRFNRNTCPEQQLLIESEGYNTSCAELQNNKNPRLVKSLYSDRIIDCP